MSLTLYMHPLASFCQKVLIAFYENDTPFEPRIVDLADETSRAEFLKIWPIGKMPVLRYDPQRKRDIGTWIGSMMTHLWVYDGELDASERVLTLNTRGRVSISAGLVRQFSREGLQRVENVGKRSRSNLTKHGEPQCDS